MYSYEGKKYSAFLAEIRPGEMLAEPVLNHQGMRLLNAKTILDEKKIGILKRHGVTSVKVFRLDFSNSA